jgi:integrase
VYLRGRIWWICYWKGGKPYFESSKSCIKADAIRMLKLRQGQIVTGNFVRADRATMGDLFKLVEEDYAARECHSLYETKLRIARHLKPFFGNLRVADFETQHVHRYVGGRQKAEPRPANATLNRELAIVTRAFRIAAEMTPPLVGHVPRMPKLKEDNVRTGFLEDEQYRTLLHQLPDYLQLLFVTAFHVGCRKGELLLVQWPQVDFKSKEIRLRPGTTKNDEGRTLPIYGDMLPWLEMAYAQHQAKFQQCLWVFQKDGERIKSFRKAWASACTRAGVPDLLFHDLRRSAVRNMERAGIPRKMAMAISGHKTEEVYRRYAMVSPRDIRDAAAKMERFFQETITKTITVPATGASKPGRSN